MRRIASLVIPPAWTDVWICPLDNGHLHATGRDARRRKQYRYHHRWRTVRDETKFERLLSFEAVLPRVRARVEADLALPGLPRDKVLAAVVRLLEMTFIRVGNEEYARTSKSFGLTTLQNHHVDVRGASIRFHFRGKSGKEHAIDVSDRRLARIVRLCQEVPGQELFQYRDDAGEWHVVDSSDVNDYLREVSGGPFTAKDFRTWAGTVLAAYPLSVLPRFRNNTQARSNVVKAIQAVAGCLGNTPAVCRKSYVHPVILTTYLEGRGLKAPVDEAAVVKLLERAAAWRADRDPHAHAHGRSSTSAAERRALRAGITWRAVARFPRDG